MSLTFFKLINSSMKDFCFNFSSKRFLGKSCWFSSIFSLSNGINLIRFANMLVANCRTLGSVWLKLSLIPKKLQGVDKYSLINSRPIIFLSKFLFNVVNLSRKKISRFFFSLNNIKLGEELLLMHSLINLIFVPNFWLVQSNSN